MPDRYAMMAGLAAPTAGGGLMPEIADLMRQQKQQRLFGALTQVGAGLMEAGAGGPYGSRNTGLAQAFQGLNQAASDPMDMMRARYMMSQMASQERKDTLAQQQAEARTRLAAMTPEEMSTPAGRQLQAQAYPEKFGADIFEETLEEKVAEAEALSKVPTPTMDPEEWNRRQAVEAANERALAQYRASLPSRDRMTFEEWKRRQDYTALLAREEAAGDLSASDLVKVPDPAGGFRYVPASEAVGMTGYEKPPEILVPGVEEARIRVAKESRPQTVINLPPGEKEFAKMLGKRQAETYTGIQEAARDAIAQNQNLDQLEQSLGQLYTGMGGAALQEARKLAKLFGVEGLEREIAAGEAGKAISGRMALQLRNPAGGAGMPGAMSDADRQFLLAMTPGLATSPEGRDVMVEALRRQNQRSIEVAAFADQYLEEKGDMRGFEQALANRFANNPDASLFADLDVPEATARIVPAPSGASPTRIFNYNLQEDSFVEQ